MKHLARNLPAYLQIGAPTLARGLYLPHGPRDRAAGPSAQGLSAEDDLHRSLCRS